MDNQIAQFTSITDASPDVARTLLESAEGDLAAALALFFDGAEDDVAPVAPTGARTPTGGVAPSPTPTQSASKRAARPAPRGGVMSFGDLRTASDNVSEPDDPANLFAGGGRSALNVVDPESRRDGENNVVDDILDKAKRTSLERTQHSMDMPSQSSAFSGRGQSISGETVGENTVSNDPEEEKAKRHLIFWQDGFTVEGGELYRYDDPANQELLEAINTGNAPLSVLNVRFGQPVELIVERRIDEKYTPAPPPPMQPFAGQGSRLGAPAVSAASAASAAPAAPAALANAPLVDPVQPTTQVQVRLPDGQRLVAKLNKHHTVADLRSYINANRPEIEAQAYTLHGSFPPRPISDEAQSLDAAGVANAVVLLKWA
ncbi:protein phosphatase regulator [Malassezia vespertilionis]|uniref:Shp1p n=1 Tax=Malassezia vespertilionis TaxID=2020962 RepID=A0A2N1J886_9BASI|nr:protein phosphatase regulator [Malassezia vespertilionis]PKI82771.1 hypothetical protein MVES_003179 [Malassezia vespertilionis]WFD08234.1 protein phosphatase regulator [Malassezia vespertilionis]